MEYKTCLFYLTSILLLILSLNYLISVDASIIPMNIDLKAGERRCIGQELDQEDIAFFSMSAELSKDKNSKKGDIIKGISAFLIGPDESTIFEETLKLKGKSVEKKHSIDSRGVYRLCFSTKGSSHGDENEYRVSFTIDYRNRGADPSKKLGKDEIPTLESQLKAAEDTLSEISKEIDFTRRQEVLLRQAGESTASRIEWFGSSSVYGK